MLCLGSIEKYCVKREICYTGRKAKKIFYNDHYSFVKSMLKKLGNHNMTVLFPNLKKRWESQHDRVISKF